MEGGAKGDGRARQAGGGGGALAAHARRQAGARTRTSKRQRCCEAYPSYILNKSSANRHASSPPGWVVGGCVAEGWVRAASECPASPSPCRLDVRAAPRSPVPARTSSTTPRASALSSGSSDSNSSRSRAGSWRQATAVAAGAAHGGREGRGGLRRARRAPSPATAAAAHTHTRALTHLRLQRRSLLLCQRAHLWIALPRQQALYPRQLGGRGGRVRTRMRARTRGAAGKA